MHDEEMMIHGHIPATDAIIKGHAITADTQKQKFLLGVVILIACMTFIQLYVLMSHDYDLYNKPPTLCICDDEEEYDPSKKSTKMENTNFNSSYSPSKKRKLLSTTEDYSYNSQNRVILYMPSHDDLNPLLETWLNVVNNQIKAYHPRLVHTNEAEDEASALGLPIVHTKDWTPEMGGNSRVFSLTSSNTLAFLVPNWMFIPKLQRFNKKQLFWMEPPEPLPPFYEWLEHLLHNPAVKRVDVITIKEYLPITLKRSMSKVLKQHRRMKNHNEERLFSTNLTIFFEHIERLIATSKWMYKLESVVKLIQNQDHRSSSSNSFRKRDLGYQLHEFHPKREATLRLHKLRAEWLLDYDSEEEVCHWFQKSLLFPRPCRFTTDSKDLRALRSTFQESQNVNPRRTKLYYIAFVKWLQFQSLKKTARLPPLPQLKIWHNNNNKPVKNNNNKIVAITQIRNVAHTIPSFLESLRDIADTVLLLDNGSTDKTTSVVSNIIKSDRRWKPGQLKLKLWLNQTALLNQSISLRWNEGASYRILLNWARSEGATHIMCPDSDEYVTANWKRYNLLRNLILGLPNKTSLMLRLFHVYNGTEKWIAFRPLNWQQSTKAPIAWKDDGVSQRGRGKHHINRVPAEYEAIQMLQSDSLGSVHFKIANIESIKVKTLWYKHLEFDSGSHVRALGSFYQSKIPINIKKRHLKPVSQSDWFDYQHHSGLQRRGTRIHPFVLPQKTQHVEWPKRWVEPESWLWRVEMIQKWREKWKIDNIDIPDGLKLPKKQWFGWVQAMKDINNNEAKPGRGHNRLLDGKCEDYWKNTFQFFNKSFSHTIYIPLSTTRTTTTKNNITIGFNWTVAPDNTMVQWLEKHEIHVRAFVQHILSKTCSGGPNKKQQQQQQIVLDVGANSGYYGLMGLAYGCRTIFVEPQPYCAKLIESSLIKNKYRGVLLRAAAGNETKTRGIHVSCNTPCYGRVGAPDVPFFGTGKRSKQKEVIHGWRPMVSLSNHSVLNSVMNGEAEIALLKIDVEGAELSVLQGLRPVFEKRAVRAATIEVTPLFYRQLGKEASERRKVFEFFKYLMESLHYEIWKPTNRKSSKNRWGKYQRLRSIEALEQYLIRERFGQHDIFILRQDEFTNDLHSPDWMDL